MSECSEYRIETLADMQKVPEDKWPAMLADVMEWLKLRAEIKPLVDAGLVEVSPYMRWIDDDRLGLSQLNITIGEPPPAGADHDD